MEASFLDLRKKSAEIIKALRRNESVTVLYRGKPAAIMQPINSRTSGEVQLASQHKVFGIWADRVKKGSVEEEVKKVRRRRFDDL